MYKLHKPFVKSKIVMTSGSSIIECIVNINTVERSEVIDIMMGQLAKNEVKVIHRDTGIDADRTVLTIIGEINSFLPAIEVIYDVVQRESLDINRYNGNHPSAGIVDVVPFVPIKNVTKVDVQKKVNSWAEHISKRYGIPIIFYGEVAKTSATKHLSQIRKGGIKSVKERLSNGELQSEYGPSHVHKSLGISSWTVRELMVAFNVSINTLDINMAKAIAKEIKLLRRSSSELRDVRVLGWYTPHYNCCQISANLYDITAISMKRFFQIVQQVAQKQGVKVIGSELIGVAPYSGYASDAKESNIQELVQYLGFDYHASFQWEDRVLEKLVERHL